MTNRVGAPTQTLIERGPNAIMPSGSTGGHEV